LFVVLPSFFFQFYLYFIKIGHIKVFVKNYTHIERINQYIIDDVASTAATVAAKLEAPFIFKKSYPSSFIPTEINPALPDAVVSSVFGLSSAFLFTSF